MTPQLIASLRQRAPLQPPTQACQVKSVSYAGDDGGIVCHLEPGDSGSEVVVVSITHLQFDPRVPLARDIAAYQKHRIKRLRRLGP
jgi:hypothetical protein